MCRAHDSRRGCPRTMPFGLVVRTDGVRRPDGAGRPGWRPPWLRSEGEAPDAEGVAPLALETVAVGPQVAGLTDQRPGRRQGAVAGRLVGVQRPGTVERALGPAGRGEPALEELAVADLGA